MKKIKILLSTLLILSLFGISNVGATYTSSTSNGYNPRILDNSLNFKAEQKDGSVYTSWTAYSKDEKFKYYKVVKSDKTSDPIYPDNSYIKYSSDVNFTSYIDSGYNENDTYYRVCAITYEKNRYCSNVVKISASTGEANDVTTSNTYVKPTVTTTTKTTSSKLSYTIKIKADKLVDTVLTTFEEKGYSDSEIITKIETINSRLETLGESKTSYKLLTDYLITKFEEKKLDYEGGFDEIENIFKDL